MLLLPGCADIKRIVRDTHGALLTVTYLTEFDLIDQPEQMDAMEKKIMDDCAPMLNASRIRIEGEEIPVFVLFDLLITYNACRKTVDAAQQVLAVLDLHD